MAGSTLNITGVQLERVSPNAVSGTMFEHVSYADQLRRCQRYLPVWISSGGVFGTGANVSSTAAWILLQCPVTTRIPTTGIAAYGSFQLFYPGQYTAPVTSLNFQGYPSAYNILITTSGTSGAGAYPVPISLLAVGTSTIYGIGAQM